MRRLLALLTVGLTLLWAQSAVAAVTAVGFGVGNSVASTTNTVTNNLAGVDCAIGSTVLVVAVYATPADTLLSVSSSPANTFQAPTDNITGTGVGVGVAYAKNTTANLANGVGTVTATFAGAVTSEIMVRCISGASATAPLDIHGITAQGLAATSATTTNTGVLNGSTELIDGIVGAPTNVGTITCGGAFSSVIGNATTPSIRICEQSVSTNASIAFSPTWTNAVNYVTDLVTFTAGGGAGGSHLLGTLGVGN